MHKYCVFHPDSIYTACSNCCHFVDAGVVCLKYHAGLSINERREAHHKFLRDEVQVHTELWEYAYFLMVYWFLLQCIAATVAFGMGIDKPDVRVIIHYGSKCTSPSLELPSLL